MTGLLHALSGAVIGSLFSKRTAAFGAGVVSHAVADIIPHKDAPLAFDLVMIPTALLLIGRARGFDSPEFAGALGGICPDFEHAGIVLGIKQDGEGLYPTHNEVLPHGRGGEFTSQVLIGVACVAALCLTSPRT